MPQALLDLALSEGLKFFSMNRRRMIRPLPLWRRFGTVAALFALIFASMAVLPHALAAPAMAWLQTEAVHVHDHGDDHEAAHLGSGDPAPCETGCVTCKDCALCSLATAALPALLPAGEGFECYASARLSPPADIDPAGLIKPPRV